MRRGKRSACAWLVAGEPARLGMRILNRSEAGWRPVLARSPPTTSCAHERPAVI